MSNLKLIAFIIALSFTSVSLAQQGDSVPTLELKHGGFVDSEDSTKRFIVVEVPGFSKESLYTTTLTHLNASERILSKSATGNNYSR